MDLIQEFNNDIWVRADEFPSLFKYNKKAKLFGDNILPTDIKQGMIGNGYLLAALSTLADRPQRIEKIFVKDCKF